MMTAKYPMAMMVRANKTAVPMNFFQTSTVSMRGFAYDERVIDHYENPRNVGSFNKKENNVGTGLVGAPACGDVMKL